jgi:hypothetical protein
MMRVRIALSLAAIASVAACYGTPAAPITEIVGTWGGDNAGLIVTDSTVHVHIGCTLGDARGPVRPDADGRFEALGTYNVDAYPIDRGITHPARFTGRIVGQSMTLTVTLTDTARQLGPVTLTYGKEPQMGPCPICRKPVVRAASRSFSRGSLSNPLALSRKERPLR